MFFNLEVSQKLRRTIRSKLLFEASFLVFAYTLFGQKSNAIFDPQKSLNQLCPEQRFKDNLSLKIWSPTIFALTVRLPIDYGYLLRPIDSIVLPIIHLKFFTWITLDHWPSNEYILVIIDAFSRWVELFLTKSTTVIRSFSIISVDSEVPKTFIPTKD